MNGQPYTFWNRLACAWAGIVQALRSERHMKVHLAALILVVVAGWWFGLDRLEWIAILLVSGLVISMELINSALEESLDHLHPDLHPAIGRAKDMASGAVLVAAIIALGIAALIFLPRMFG